VTPVKDQGSAGTCWAFAAVGVIESRWAISNVQPNPTLDLSEQNLVCAGNVQGFGNIDSGYPYLGIDYVYRTGIVDEATMPYNQTNTAPNWPITGAYSLYKISADWTMLNNSTVDPIKAALAQGGPLLGEMLSTTDWYTPADPPVYPSMATPGFSVDAQVSYADSSALEPTGGIDHSVVITGYTDDPTAPGGGYWHVKNSWGADWGNDGCGYIDYQTMEESDHHIFEDDGSVYTVVVPEPATLSLLAFGCLAMLRRRCRP
jgi:C1A family cysteine protease